MFETVFYLAFLLTSPIIGGFWALWRGFVAARGRFDACTITANDEGETTYEAIDLGGAGRPLGLSFFCLGIVHLALVWMVWKA